MSVTVHFIGTGTCALSANNATSCYVVDIDGNPLVMDLGNGAQHRLLKAGLDPKSLGRILFSHAHPDHISDIMMLLQSMLFTPGYGRTQPLTMVGPVPVFEYFDMLSDFYHGTFRPRSFELNRVAVRPGDRFELADCVVEVHHMEHFVDAVGYRIAAKDRVVCYTGDTDAHPGLSKFLTGADLAIVDASFLFAHKCRGHLTVREAALAAAGAGVKTLALSHRNPVYTVQQAEAEAREAGFVGDIILPDDGDRFTVAP